MTVNLNNTTKGVNAQMVEFVKYVVDQFWLPAIGALLIFALLYYEFDREFNESIVLGFFTFVLLAILHSWHFI